MIILITRGRGGVWNWAKPDYVIYVRSLDVSIHSQETWSWHYQAFDHANTWERPVNAEGRETYTLQY